jgi:hypothetical protein
MKIIAYTYEADYHCIDCTVKQFESSGFNKFNALDNDGNIDEWQELGESYLLVHPVFDYDEWQELDANFLEENPTQYLACGDCHEIIEEYKHE